jgi:hypothetical protein
MAMKSFLISALKESNRFIKGSVVTKIKSLLNVHRSKAGWTFEPHFRKDCVQVYVHLLKAGHLDPWQ